MSATPDDLEVQDGILDLSLNLINEHGNLAAIQPPKVLARFPDNCAVVALHEVLPNTTCYIIRNVETNQFYWVDKLEEYPNVTPIPEDHEFDGGGASPISMLPMGMVMIMLTDQGMRYWLFDTEEMKYEYLGDEVPDVGIDFALATDESYEQDRLIESDTITLDQKGAKDEYLEFLERLDYACNKTANKVQEKYRMTREKATSAENSNNSEIDALFTTITEYVFKAINSVVGDAEEDSKFCFPFFIRYAVKMVDGSYCKASAPILMIPSSSYPSVNIKSLAYDHSQGTNKRLAFTHKLSITRCDLYLKIKSIGGISKWESLISGVDIFVSPPIYTYDQSAKVKGIKFDLEEYFTHCGKRGKSSGEKFSYDINHMIDFEENLSFGYQPFNREEVRVNGTLGEDNGMRWDIDAFTTDKVESDIIANANFYKILSIDLKDIQQMSGFAKVVLPKGTLKNISTKQRLEDDFQSHNTLIPSIGMEYNARLNLTGLKMEPFDGFKLTDMTQYTSDASTDVKSVDIFVRIAKQNCARWVRCPSERVSYDLETFFPRYLFYPDPDAKEMIIRYGGKYCRLTLKEHDYLNGAYWFRGLTMALPAFEVGDVPYYIIESANSNKTIPLPNKVYNSEVNNPFVFQAKNVVTVGPGEIRGISTAAKALSQGQFGQFPLYAFTDEGVWALETSSTGSYVARQPITRDVCINPAGITQIDSAVLFPTDRGIMHLSGSEASCISDPLFENYPINHKDGLKGFAKFAGQLLSKHNECIPLVPFTTFLKDCGMVYDYVNQRLMVFNPAYRYAYVYSLKSKLWGMAYSNIQSAVNSYPGALAMSNDQELLDYSNLHARGERAPEDPKHQLLLTRPIKIDNPYSLKSILNMIVRGTYRKGALNTVLYGSRDLFNWHIVGTSADGKIQGFRGHPTNISESASLRIFCRTNPSSALRSITLLVSARSSDKVF